MFDMLKTIILDVLGIKPAPAQPVYYTPAGTCDSAATAPHNKDSKPIGYPFVDATGVVGGDFF